jgi:hypothetical protein
MVLLLRTVASRQSEKAIEPRLVPGQVALAYRSCYANPVPLDDFWRKRGYEPVPGLVAYYSWKDIGEAQETEKPMQFWMRRL